MRAMAFLGSPCCAVREVFLGLAAGGLAHFAFGQFSCLDAGAFGGEKPAGHFVCIFGIAAVLGHGIFGEIFLVVFDGFFAVRLVIGSYRFEIHEVSSHKKDEKYRQDGHIEDAGGDIGGDEKDCHCDDAHGCIFLHVQHFAEFFIHGGKPDVSTGMEIIQEFLVPEAPVPFVALDDLVDDIFYIFLQPEHLVADEETDGGKNDSNDDSNDIRIHKSAPFLHSIYIILLLSDMGKGRKGIGNGALPESCRRGSLFWEEEDYKKYRGPFFIPLVEIYSLYDHSSFGSRKYEIIEI